MGVLGTFASFNTARLGIYTSQKGLDVTGNNIANINTPGYTRQVLDQIALKTGGKDRYQNIYDARVGNGSLSVGISQIRDPYLDIRYRTEMSSVGAMQSKLSALQDLRDILDEVGKGDEEFGIIDAQFSDFVNSLQKLTTNTNEGEFDVQARTSARALVSLFNSTAKKLTELYENTQKNYDSKVKEVNEILTKIRDLNESIRKSEIHGDGALEQRDTRNNLIDQLSEYIKIDVVYSMEDIGGGQEVEKLTIKLGNANPDPGVATDRTTLVDGLFAGQLSTTQVPRKNSLYDPAETDQTSDSFYQYLMPDGAGLTNDITKAEMVDDEYYRLTVSALTDSRGKILNSDKADQAKYPESKPVELDDNDLYGSLQAVREMLTEKGEFSCTDEIQNIDENAASKRGIQYYQRSLDLLANQFAAAFNEMNTGYMKNEAGEYIDKDGNSILLNGSPIKDTGLSADQQAALDGYTPPTLEAYLKDYGGYQPSSAGVLFSNRGDNNLTDGITAANISISSDWANNAVHLVTTYTRHEKMEPGTTDNSNITHMIAQMDAKRKFFPKDVMGDIVADKTDMFYGSFQEMFTNMESVLGNDSREANIMLNNYYTTSVDLDSGRMSVSSVDLNDEAANMMQYQKSYAAACRLMTVLDQALEKLINGTGVVGL